MGDARLEQIVSVRQVAKAAGWKYHRMLRHLQKHDEAMGGMLLVRTGHGSRTRYSLTMSALERLHPQWFQRVQSLVARVESLEERADEAVGRIAELDGMVGEAHTDLGDLKRKVDRLEDRLKDALRPRIEIA